MEYARDLGLLAQHDAKRIANPIYAEVIPRELTWVAQDDVEVETAWYVDAGGGLDVDKLLAAFQQFFREHSEHWTQRFDRYQEAGPQLLLQAYLQKVVNGGGRIEREYALGSGRVDLLIVWPQGDRTRRFVVECKVLHKGSGADHRRGAGADARRHGPLRCGGGAPDRLRSRAGADVGGEALPARAGVGPRASHRLGHVTAGAITLVVARVHPHRRPTLSPLVSPGDDFRVDRGRCRRASCWSTGWGRYQTPQPLQGPSGEHEQPCREC